MLQIYLLGYVLPHNHVINRRLYHSFCDQQDQHRSTPYHQNTQSGRNTTQRRIAVFHGGGVLRFDVD
jgi:hypothetical protein